MVREGRVATRTQPSCTNLIANGLSLRDSVTRASQEDSKIIIEKGSNIQINYQKTKKLCRTVICKF